MHPEFDEFLEQLEEMIGYLGQVYKLTEDHETPLWVVVYDDVPDDGSITAFTYGVSLVDQPGGQPARELVLSVESDNVDWGFATGFVGKSFRGQCPFDKGDVLKFGEKMVQESELTAFVVYPPTVLEEDQYQLELEDRTLELMQLVPIYEEEIAVLEQEGIDAFFAAEDFDIYKVNRPRRTLQGS